MHAMEWANCLLLVTVYAWCYRSAHELVTGECTDSRDKSTTVFCYMEIIPNCPLYRYLYAYRLV